MREEYAAQRAASSAIVALIARTAPAFLFAREETSLRRVLMLVRTSKHSGAEVAGRRSPVLVLKELRRQGQW
jgi:hypothetical protein